MIDLSLGHMRARVARPSVGVVPQGGYGDPSGRTDLRAAIAVHHGVPVECVAVTTGSSMAFVSLLVSRRPDKLLIPVPYFPAYTAVPRLLGFDTVHYTAATPTGAADAASAICAMREWPGNTLVWNFPHNPTGVLDDAHTRSRVLRAAVETGTELILDCVYDHLVFTDYEHVAGLPGPGEVRVFSFSKSRELAGERVGYLVADPKRVEQAVRAHWALAMSPPAASQKLALAAMVNSADDDAEMLLVLHERRDLVTDLVSSSNRLTFRPPAGGIFGWLEIPGLGISSKLVVDVCARAGVLVADGAAFGATDPPAVRISLAVPAAELEAGVRILLAVVDRLASRSVQQRLSGDPHDNPILGALAVKKVSPSQPSQR